MPISCARAKSYELSTLAQIAAFAAALCVCGGAALAGPRLYDMSDAISTPLPVQPADARMFQTAQTPSSNRSDSGPKEEGIVSEVRLGVMHHDAGIFGRSVEEDVDINFEVLFTSPEFLRFLFAPRPHLGITYAPDDDTTSQVYFGLTWQYSFWGGAFIEGSLGGSVNDGSKQGSPTEKALGCHLLFRESVSIGYVFERRHAVMATLDHISNARLCDENDGLDTIGVRYGYRF